MKIKLTEEQLAKNYLDLIECIKTNITGDRKDKLLALYDKLADRIAVAPASSVETFHGCYPGGYVLHVLNVINCASELYSLWKKMGAFVDDYTFEELMFAAINHDLGKIGDMEHDYYIPNPSEWHVKNQGRVYVDNPELTYMSHSDRCLWLLQSNGILISQNEFLAIKLHDGAYLEDNKSYYNAFQEHRKIRTNIIYILHYADYMAARIEYEKEREYRKTLLVKDSVIKHTKSKLSESTALKSANDLFSKMFDKTEKQE